MAKLNFPIIGFVIELLWVIVRCVCVCVSGVIECDWLSICNHWIPCIAWPPSTYPIIIYDHWFYEWFAAARRGSRDVICFCWWMFACLNVACAMMSRELMHDVHVMGYRVVCIHLLHWRVSSLLDMLAVAVSWTWASGITTVYWQWRWCGWMGDLRCVCHWWLHSLLVWDDYWVC